MKIDRLDYTLPDELIAQRPPAERDGGRLLVLEAGRVSHRQVRDFPDLLEPGSLLVLNDSRVRRARVLAQRSGGGGRVELLFLRRRPELETDARQCWETLGRANKSLRPGQRLNAAALEFEVVGRADEGTLIVAVDGDVEYWLAEHGRVPIPPYLKREDDADDVQRYQTVYARRATSAAAPTAGLHLSHALFARIRERGVGLARLELEVGLGTFRPVQVEDLDAHPMHAEKFNVDAELVQAVLATRRAGGKVVAVGTSVVRALESAADPARPGQVLECCAETRLLIQPGYQFRVVDALLTNFHVPRSTLLALVGAFAGLDATLGAYREAVAERYRFLSYGDAMWIPRRVG